jgi:CO/xanthine dehydrogenase Mo-binding subunit
VGEGGAVAPLAAIANAIVDAFRPLKLAINRTPMHPEQVLAAIRAAEAPQEGSAGGSA